MISSPTEELADQKRVEFYASSVDAWYNTSIERDKSILALSAGAIGLLVTLLTTVGVSSLEELILYVGALLSFVVTLVVVLRIFKCNRAYIEDVISGNVTGDDPKLGRLDSIAIFAFAGGVTFTALIGFATAVHSYSQKEKAMVDKNTSRPSTPMDLNKSFNGAAKLQPQVAAPTATPAATPAAPGAAVPAAPAATGQTSGTDAGNGGAK